MPEIRPKKNPDGSCVSHVVQKGKGCKEVATYNGLTTKDLEDFNKNTWGMSFDSILSFLSNSCVVF
jgi:hypothetical protein